MAASTEPSPQSNTVARDTAWSRLDWIALTVITIGAAALRLLRLGDPATLVFDESYYARDACWYVETSQQICGIGSEQTSVHPPLGKWLISMGIELFGNDAFGWRVMAALAGTIMVALTFLVARKLLGSTAGALVSAGLLAVDPLHFVQSRIAMLDIFVALFTLTAFGCILFDRDRMLSAPGGSGIRPWRLAAGVAAGCAGAAKWSGLFAVAGVIALTIVWEVAARRAVSHERPLMSTLRTETPTLVGWLMLVPLLVYLATFAGRVEGEWLAAPWSEGAWLRAWWDRQVYQLTTSRGLTSSHPYQSPAWSWPLLKRPVSYYFETPGGEYAEILGTGNPFVWWTSMLALVMVGVRWVRRRRFGSPEGYILATTGFTYLPWLVLTGDRSAVFLFYMLPVLPFLFLAPGYLAAAIGRSWEARVAVALYTAGAIGLFAFLYPVLAKVAIPEEQWRSRIWIFDNCDKPHSSPSADESGSGTGEEDVPPAGWCWI